MEKDLKVCKICNQTSTFHGFIEVDGGYEIYTMWPPSCSWKVSKKELEEFFGESLESMRADNDYNPMEYYDGRMQKLEAEEMDAKYGEERRRMSNENKCSSRRG